MNEKNESYAYFVIAGGFDPVDVTARVGVTPSQAWAKGDLAERTKQRRESSSWSLYSRLDRSATLESHVQDVLEQLDSNKADFRALSVEYGGVMELVGYFYDYYPGLFFNRRTVEHLAEYALSMDYDFYFWDKPEAPTPAEGGP
ncbi:MAG TPA: DUF4279 domain-containing protein [Candidatus Angelobacter sp.]|jgi:hypothetical protein|nr:DUF4279 domain-containing protein [Candidatus Angelobacter sp.]